ncbi:unnamed protein product [Ceutorhynchus assimilis]|uniref:MIF4G domain-containing protein n=1 Tax=Ceutorhynchus assimilis TaxID=467358 RepID=A0A9N9MBT6_9CUCU|nr:unnamed protein product [Ceutorhynchus assimilis]
MNEGDKPKPAPLWNPSGSSVQKRLREPKMKLVQEAATSKNTVLRAEAPEFVPRQITGLEHQFQNVNITVDDLPKRSSAQSRLLIHKNPTSHSEQGSSQYHPPNQVINGQSSSTDMVRLKQLIDSLIKYPGQFDDLMMVILETICPYLDDIMAISEIVKLLVSQAINAPSFRYNGARLCWVIEQKSAEFRADLHLKCNKELQDNPNQQNVALFIAELYTQLPHDSLYGSLLIEALKKLLSTGGTDNIKCVCQALKLTGFSLEDNHKLALDELFCHLRDYTNSLSGSALIVLNSVINLRESNWGREPESAHSEPSPFDQDYEEIVNEILYEVDGATLTNEEQEFLAANMGQDDYIFDNEDPDGLCNPEEEMDEEIRAAFVEFVKTNKN